VKVIGLMSGTSADAVDAVLVEWPEGPAARPFELLGSREDPIPDALRARIHRLAAARVPGAEALAELASLDVELGERFAASAAALAADAGLTLADVEAIASHGQTVAHHPERRATLQIGDPSVIAERTGRTTIADFRPRDVAAGGEGAPLAPFFHFAALAEPDEGRIVLNLGGIANVTWLPRGAKESDVVAFDVGPANALLDGAVLLQTEGAASMDVDGQRARRGSADPGLLERLLDDDFLRRPPPKSTGRERYGLAEAEALVAAWRRDGGAPDDLIATLAAFTVESVARACRTFLHERDGSRPACIDRLLLSGGGARNPVLREGLARALPDTRVEPLDAAGVPAAACEAMAFSLMGRNALLGLPNSLPSCTGASGARVLGEIVPGGPGQSFRARPSSATSKPS
jgi:anhydro-N-acetylmuramic acid kinase